MPTIYPIILYCRLDEISPTLTVTDTRMESAGAYQCVVYNHGGNSTSVAIIHITSKSRDVTTTLLEMQYFA